MSSTIDSSKDSPRWTEVEFQSWKRTRTDEIPPEANRYFWEVQVPRAKASLQIVNTMVQKK